MSGASQGAWTPRRRTVASWARGRGVAGGRNKENPARRFADEPADSSAAGLATAPRRPAALKTPAKAAALAPGRSDGSAFLGRKQVAVLNARRPYVGCAGPAAPVAGHRAARAGTCAAAFRLPVVRRYTVSLVHRQTGSRPAVFFASLSGALLKNHGRPAVPVGAPDLKDSLPATRAVAGAGKKIESAREWRPPGGRNPIAVGDTIGLPAFSVREKTATSRV